MPVSFSHSGPEKFLSSSAWGPASLMRPIVMPLNCLAAVTAPLAIRSAPTAVDAWSAAAACSVLSHVGAAAAAACQPALDQGTRAARGGARTCTPPGTCPDRGARRHSRVPLLSDGLLYDRYTILSRAPDVVKSARRPSSLRTRPHCRADARPFAAIVKHRAGGPIPGRRSAAKPGRRRSRRPCPPASSRRPRSDHEGGSACRSRRWSSSVSIDASTSSARSRVSSVTTGRPRPRSGRRARSRGSRSRTSPSAPSARVDAASAASSRCSGRTPTTTEPSRAVEARRPAPFGVVDREALAVAERDNGRRRRSLQSSLEEVHARAADEPGHEEFAGRA